MRSLVHIQWDAEHASPQAVVDHRTVGELQDKLKELRRILGTTKSGYPRVNACRGETTLGTLFYWAQSHRDEHPVEARRSDAVRRLNEFTTQWASYGRPWLQRNDAGQLVLTNQSCHALRRVTPIVRAIDWEVLRRA